MSYYRGSMSTRGRSSFRGNSYRGSSGYRGTSNYRGSNSYGERGGGYSSGSTRGGRYHSSGNSYTSGYQGQDNRSRYPGSGDKYNSRGRDDGYRRSSYRGDESYSSSRDHSRGSPDRKRMRTDQGSSARRSNDVSYNTSGSGDSYQRYESSGYGGAERRYSSERRPRSPKDFRTSRNESSMYNKSGDSASMPPPRTTRGSFRGRLMSSRGSFRGRGTFARNKRVSDLYTKRRIISRTFDYARRLKIQKMRSAIKKHESGSSNDSEKDWDAELDEQEKKTAEDKDEISIKKKVSPKKEKSEKKATSGDEGSDKEDNGSGDDEAQGDEESDKDEDKEQDASSKELPRSRFTGRSFIKLTCVHCHTKCVTFKEYILHLRSSKHASAMRRVAVEQKTQLARMRLFQRNNQRDLDEKNKDIPGLRTQFCPLCKLNYRQLKSKHQMSEAHRDMRKFLMPYCNVCRTTYKSPMLYEAHLCSLDHIKRKARSDYIKSTKADAEEDASADEGVKELDLDNFMTLDSVGDVDDVDDEDEEAGQDKKETSDSEKAPKAPKPEINVGNEHVRKVEVYYCELCKMYLPRHEDLESALKKHCRTRSHLQKYVRYRDDKALRKEAERIHRKNQEAKEAKEKEAEKMDVSASSTPKKDKDTSNCDLNNSKNDSNTHVLENGSIDEEDAVDEKLWADVDKDLGELLREVEPNKSSDDEDDSRATSVRYDRFRYSDKKGGVDEKGATKTEDSKNDAEQLETSDTSAKVKDEEK